jgi:hypothetical protein
MDLLNGSILQDIDVSSRGVRFLMFPAACINQETDRWGETSSVDTLHVYGREREQFDDAICLSLWGQEAVYILSFSD